MLRMLSLTFLVAAAALAVLAWDVSERLRAPLPIESPQIVQFESGSSLSSLLRKLEGRGFLAPARTTLYLRVYARLHGSATQLHAGEYALEPGITALGLLDLLASGDVLEYSFTIIEGWTVRELLAALRAQEAIRWTLGDPAPTADTLMATLDLGDAHAEGQFLPETYRYARGASDVSLLQRAHRAMRRTLDQVWAQRVDGLPLKSAYDALILASIVEKETGQPSERGQIAGVFTRRLQKNMRLQTDPTVIYGIGEAFDGMAKVVRATDLFGGRIHDPCHNLIQSKHVVRQVRVVVQFLGPSLDGIHLIPIFSEELVPDLTNLHT